jgi:hypothetical protein
MASSEGYGTFIKEAFIDPIRSVLIVDDDYPTFSEVLDRQASDNIGGGVKKASIKRWIKDPEAIKKVIDSFRNFDRPLLVDIYDGDDGGEEKKVAFHLHQSDLLVLDYQLDGVEGGGTKAIEILRSVMANDHFNLVVVHTSAPLDDAFAEILLGLMSRCSKPQSEAHLNTAQKKVEAAELEMENFYDRLQSSFSREQYFEVRNDGKSAIAALYRGAPPFSEFKMLCDEIGWKGADVAQVFKWTINEYENRNAGKMHLPNAGLVLKWSDKGKWIRSQSAFIAFTNKTDKDINILDELCDSLVAWGPKPSRLFLTKLRSQLEEFGVAAEDAALGNNFVLARWYRELLEGSDLARRTLIGVSVARHSEQLLDFILPRVEEFARRLIEVDAGSAVKGFDLIKSHFGVDLTDAAQSSNADRAHNVFACSKEPHGWHIETGHIFRAAGEYWVCLSPSCDLVPEQKESGHFKDVSDHIPFFAVKLRVVPDRTAIDVHSNRYFFIKADNTIKTFCINDPLHLNSAPQWYPLYAEAFGVLRTDKTFSFSKLEMENGKLLAKTHTAQIVGQLRYEYAINLMQALGANFTRVGLDFLGGKQIV